MFSSKVTNIGRFTIIEREDNNHTIIVEIQDSVVDSIFARGIAKLNPSDHFDSEIGSGIAFGRALEKFGRKMERYWESLSETESQHRGRIKAEQRDIEFFHIFMALRQAQKKLSRKPSQAPTVVQEATEMKPVTTSTSNKKKGAHK